MFKKTLITIGLILSLVVVIYSQVPPYINYQGMLTDATGTPLTGSFTINFRIYDASVGGSLLWGPQTHTVNADVGIFNAVLGPIDYSVFDGSERWLSLQVGSDAEMTPRKRLISVGYSFRAYDADKVDGKDASAFVQTGQANSISTGMIQNDAVTKQKVLPDIVSSLDGVSNDGGNIDLVGGTGITINPDDANNKITIKVSGGGGDNLGNHSATQNIKLNGKWLSNDGGNEGIKVANNGNVNASGDVVAGDHLWAVNGPVVAENRHVRTGVTKPAYVGNGDIYAKNDLIASGYVRTGSPSSGYGTGDVVADDEVIADRNVIAQRTVYGYGNSASYGVYGSGAGGSYGVYGTKSGHYGYLGSSSYAVFGRYSSNIYGFIGSSSYGAYGKNSTRWGTLGGPNYGAYGANGSRYGYLGGSIRGVQGFYDSNHWGFMGSSTYGGYFVGNVRVIGTLIKSAGAFEIDHPLDPANKYLKHSFVESPDMMNIYNGNVELDMNGEAWVELPDWYEALNKDHRYQLTPMGVPGPNLYVAEKMNNNRFKIAGGSSGMEVSWQVTGVRQDAYANAHRIQVEVEKIGKERGKYIHPVEHGMPTTLSMDYDELLEMEKNRKMMEEQSQIMEAEEQKMQEEKKRDESERQMK